MAFYILEYADGLRANVLELNGAAGEWSAAWRYADGRAESSLFWTQEGRPAMHFTWLLHGIEHMMLTGKPSWNVERTLFVVTHVHLLPVLLPLLYRIEPEAFAGSRRRTRESSALGEEEITILPL